MTTSGALSSTSAVAAVSVFMVKDDGSTPVEATNMPLLIARKSKRARVTTGAQRRRTAAYSSASVPADMAPSASLRK